jgi:hypothetical protein
MRESLWETTYVDGNWCAERDGSLWAERDGFRMEVRGHLERGGSVRFIVLRRQYGRGSVLALVASGTASNLAEAMAMAEGKAAKLAGSALASHSDCGPL